MEQCLSNAVTKDQWSVSSTPNPIRATVHLSAQRARLAGRLPDVQVKTLQTQPDFCTLLRPYHVSETDVMQFKEEEEEEEQ